MSVAISHKSSQSDAPNKELTVIARVIKGDTYMVIADAAKELDDEFVNLDLYKGEGNGVAIEPPYNPKSLKALMNHNNVLNQCVHAMEVNIDGTGHEFVAVDDKTPINEQELIAAKEFFNEPYPGKSFLGMRRDMRRDVEGMGWGFFEVLRNLPGDVVSVRYLEGQTIRLAKLQPQVQLTYSMQRAGKEVQFTVWERPRRFMQVLNGKTKQYFKEFGCPLELNRNTGEWAALGQVIPAEERATEVLYFGADHDVSTPYYVPRWINQLPSVLGSRKAEEQNLEFFDSGGMPPAIIFIQGGKAIASASEQLRTYLSASNKRKGRAVVVELESSAGTIDSGGSVSAKVERFGAERANDAMYSNYDKAAEEHVRIGFRLPPLFLGKAADYNYATAVVAYQVAEAQVFGPERQEFDEVVNKTLIKALGFKTLKFKSLPITLKSVDETFKGLALLDGKVDGEAFVKEVNKIIGTDLPYEEPEEPLPPPVGKIDPLTGLPYDKPVAPLPTPVAPEKTPVKRLEVLKLARKVAVAKGLAEGESEDAEALTVLLKGLNDQDHELVRQAVRLYERPADNTAECC